MSRHREMNRRSPLSASRQANNDLQRHIALLERSLLDALASASESPGVLSAGEAEHIQNLRTTLEAARNELERRSHTKRYIITAAALFSFAVIFLATTRVCSTYVEGELTVAALALHPDQSIIEFKQDARLLRVAGFDSAAILAKAYPLSVEPVVFTPIRSGDWSGFNIEQLAQADGARLSLRTSGEGNAVVSGSIEPSRRRSSQLQLTGYGRTKLASRDTTLEVDFGQGTALTFHMTNKFDFEATLLDTSSILLRNIVCDSLVFMRAEHLASGSLEFSTVRSDILEGTLRIPGLQEEAYTIPPAEPLRIAASRLYVRDIRVTPRGLRISFAAQARSVRLGSNDLQRELKPLRLVWLFTSHTAAFIQTALVVGITLIATLITYLFRR